MAWGYWLLALFEIVVTGISAYWLFVVPRQREIDYWDNREAVQFWRELRELDEMEVDW